MLGIMTKYHGPTNHRGSRLSATVRDGAAFTRRVYVAYDYELSPSGDGVYRKAAEAMCEKLTAEGFTYTNPEKLISGYVTDGYIFVFTKDALGSLEPKN